MSPSHYVPETPLPDTERVTKRRKLDHPDHLVALNQLQQYSSYRDDESSKIGLPAQPSRHSPPSTTCPPPLSEPESKPLDLSTLRDLDTPNRSGGCKRPTTVDGKYQKTICKASAKIRCIFADRRSPKRRKTTPEHSVPGVGRRQSDQVRRVKRRPHNRPTPKYTQSEPVSPTFPISYLHDDSSQTTEYRKREMVLDWVAAPGGRESYPSRLDGGQPSSPERAQVGYRDTMSPDPSSPEDYNSWEASISVEEMRRLQREFGGSGKSVNYCCRNFLRFTASCQISPSLRLKWMWQMNQTAIEHMLSPVRHKFQSFRTSWSNHFLRRPFGPQHSYKHLSRQFPTKPPNAIPDRPRIYPDS